MEFYVYRWFNVETGFTFYIGKGCKNRYKTTKKRNNLFKEYYKNNVCAVQILERFDNEEDAFFAEHRLIMQYKSVGECTCNLDTGGSGGVNFIWTDEMREYKSLYNPMKSLEQRKRMSVSNPMKDAKIAKKVGLQHIKKPVIGGVLYDDVYKCASVFGVHVNTIRNWCKRGYSTDYAPCRYEHEKQKNINAPDRNNRQTVIIDGIEFKSMRDGAKYLGCDPSVLTKAVKNGKPYKKTHYCKYGNQQPSQTKSDNSSLEGSTTNE